MAFHSYIFFISIHLPLEVDAAILGTGISNNSQTQGQPGEEENGPHLPVAVFKSEGRNFFSLRDKPFS